jgi:hypothetical protein
MINVLMVKSELKSKTLRDVNTEKTREYYEESGSLMCRNWGYEVIEFREDEEVEVVDPEVRHLQTQAEKQNLSSEFSMFFFLLS